VCIVGTVNYDVCPPALSPLSFIPCNSSLSMLHWTGFLLWIFVCFLAVNWLCFVNLQPAPIVCVALHCILSVYMQCMRSHSVVVELGERDQSANGAMHLLSRVGGAGGGWGMDEAIPLVRVSALYYPQCFNTDGWMTRTTFGPLKTLFH